MLGPAADVACLYKHIPGQFALDSKVNLVVHARSPLTVEAKKNVRRRSVNARLGGYGKGLGNLREGRRGAIHTDAPRVSRIRAVGHIRAYAVHSGTAATDGLAEAVAQKRRQHHVHGVIPVVNPGVAAADDAALGPENLAQEASTESRAPGG